MSGPVSALLSGDRLHLQHGPIDLVCQAEGPGDAQGPAYAAASRRFDGLLQGLVDELPLLRAPLAPDGPAPLGPVARRMHRAALPHAGTFLTPMIAVAGAVADEVLAAMLAAAPLTRAFVNNGGDIALHLASGHTYRAAMAGLDGADLGRVSLRSGDGIGGMATSGAGGRSHSFGIADSVTVLAGSAAAADAAATLIANAVDLPDHPGIVRVAADTLQPDSDLGHRAVVTHVPPLARADRHRALDVGAARAETMLARSLVRGVALFLQGEARLLGAGFAPQDIAGTTRPKEVTYAET